MNYFDIKSNKIKTLKELQKIVQQLRGQNKTIVFTNGCFDILHAGHLYCLEKAKQQGDVLIVALNSDRSIKKIKDKGRPIISEKHRAYLISGLSCVDYCIIFHEPTPIKIIEAIKPDILVKGRDYKKREIVGNNIIKEKKGRIIRIPLIPGISTSLIIKKIIQIYKNGTIKNN
ncbi:MAG TPA: D-glycero-beta-D-manno-heptose 1-phosphate adenylyltransferase [bacterium]|nr:D-glycero-beta-D-manno-heptose 1-phosphate adenylyltransferase [bacterium]